MKFIKNKAIKFGWNGLKGWAYNSKDDFASVSAAYFEVSKSHGKVKSNLSDRIYYVIEGKGEFIIGNEKISVKTSDVVIVPKETWYDYKAIGGILKLFLVHAPAYDEKFEEINKSK